MRPALRPRQPDMGEAPLLLEARPAVLVEGALGGEQALLPAGQKDRLEFEALGGVERHQRDAVLVAILVRLHDERDMLQEGRQVREFLHGADQLLEVLQPPLRVGRFLLGPHVRIAGFLQDRPGQVVMGRRLQGEAPALEMGHEVPERPAGGGLHLVRFDEIARGLHQWHAGAAGMGVKKAQGRLAEAALRHVDDALEGEVVGGLGGGAQIGEGVADLRPLVEARAADHAIGQAERDEAVLDLAHLGGDAHQHRDLRQLVPGGVDRFDLLADLARLLLRIPGARDADALARHVVGAQGLAEPVLVLRDEAGGGREDMAGRAVVALEADDRRARKIVLEAQDVVDLRAPPAIDRLVVVADAAEVLARLGEEAQPQILRDVGVLVLVHQHVAEALLVLLQHVRVLAPEPQAFEQEVAEIRRVQRLQPLLVGAVEPRAAPVREDGRLSGGYVLRGEAPVLPAVDEGGELARRPALLVDLLGRDDLLEQPDLVVGAEDGEIRAQPDQLGMAAQDLGADRMEGAEPGHALARRPGETGDALLHLARRLVGEGDRQDAGGPGAAGRDEMGDSRREHAGLAGPGPGEDQDGSFGGLDRLPLLRIEAGQVIGRSAMRGLHG